MVMVHPPRCHMPFASVVVVMEWSAQKYAPTLTANAAPLVLRASSCVARKAKQPINCPSVLRFA